MSEYPNRVPKEEQKEATAETVPQDVLESALSMAVRYGECPECDTRQFYPVMVGHNTMWDCRECGYTMRIVG